MFPNPTRGMYNVVVGTFCHIWCKSKTRSGTFKFDKPGSLWLG